jgi:hypothetical protein
VSLPESCERSAHPPPCRRQRCVWLGLIVLLRCLAVARRLA